MSNRNGSSTPSTACDGRLGGVVPCGGDQLAGVDHAGIRQIPTVDAGIGDRRRQIGGGIVAFRGGRRAEVFEDVVDDAEQVFGRRASFMFGVVHSEQFVGRASMWST
jgi:hypothetical protein